MHTVGSVWLRWKSSCLFCISIYAFNWWSLVYGCCAGESGARSGINYLFLSLCLQCSRCFFSPVIFQMMYGKSEHFLMKKSCPHDQQHIPVPPLVDWTPITSGNRMRTAGLRLHRQQLHTWHSAVTLTFPMAATPNFALPRGQFLQNDRRPGGSC